MDNKKIILAITPDVKLYECFLDNLKKLGFDVYLVCNNHFRYKNFKDKLVNFYKKSFLKNKTYKRELARKYNSIENSEKLSSFPNTDYSLIIRADLFDKKTIQTIVSKSKKNYSYQWDGLSRFAEVKNSIPLFNKFYVFDKDDLKINNTFPSTNFYFDCYPDIFKNIEPEFDAYFIGSYDSRINTLITICELLDSHGLKLNIMLCCSPKKHLKKYKYITFIKNSLSYYENLKMVANSKMLIDIHHDNLHKGLSFRAFEALGYDKKLITSNEIIKQYDFYNQNNIYVINHDNLNFNTFLDSNYQDVQIEVKAKYSFTNWINYILEKDNSSPLFIP